MPSVVAMTPQPGPDASVPDAVAGAVVVYWRPGCPFCSSLRRQLRRAGVPTTDVNIWSDPAAAAEVRRHASGNETVPTVVIGEDALVNPSAKMVVALATRAGIELVEPTGWLAQRRNKRRSR